MKKKKIGILASAIATVAICICMIAGATFALFTSNDSVNITVTSGKVAVTATVSDVKLTRPVVIGEEEVNVTTYETEGKEVSLENIIPGDTVEFSVTLENEGNVNAKYRLSLEAVEGLRLVSAFDTTINENEYANLLSYKSAVETIKAGETATYDVKMVLDSEKGNDYQDITAKIEAAVYAVQYNAAFEGEEEVETAPEGMIVCEAKTTEELVAAAAIKNSYIVLRDNVSTGTLKLRRDATIDLNGNAITADYIQVEAYKYGAGKGANITIKNGTLNITDFRLYGDASVVTFDNVNIHTDGTQAVFAGYGDKAVINSGSYEGRILFSAGGKVNFYVDIENKTLTDANKVVYAFDSMEYVYIPGNGGVYLKVGNLIDGELPAGVTVNEEGYVVEANLKNYGLANYYLLNLRDEDVGKSSITVYGGTFKNFNPADNKAENPAISFVAEGYEVVYVQDELSNYWFTVVAANEVAGYVANGYTHYVAA